MPIHLPERKRLAIDANILSILELFSLQSAILQLTYKESFNFFPLHGINILSILRLSLFNYPWYEVQQLKDRF